MPDEITNQEQDESATPEEQQPQRAQYSGKEAASTTDAVEQVLTLLKQLHQTGLSIPIAFRTTAPSQEEKQFMEKINNRLVGKIILPKSLGEGYIKPISVAFPQCSDVLLSLIKTTDTDEITGYFNDYFMFCDHNIMINKDAECFRNVADTTLLNCTKKWFPRESQSTCAEDVPPVGARASSGQEEEKCIQKYPYTQTWPPIWPPPWCLPPSCVTLAGKRHFYTGDGIQIQTGWIKRLFIADLVWLFYFERLGIFKILGVILDDFATKGKIPISNGAVNPPGDPVIKDDVIAIVLESMVRQTKMGLSSTVRDRDSSYRRCLGWTSDVGRRLDLGSAVNSAFTTLFHKFIQNALEFYKDKRLATAIQGVSSPVAKTSVATLLTISDTLDLIKKAFDPFDYGRNYSNTLNGIVWAIASMALIRELRATLGIPAAYENPYEYIPAAYDLLVMKRQITPSETNRYTAHRECANDARDILLDMEIIDHKDTKIGGELELWLSIIEDKIEGYRTAYRSLTGIDLGAPGTPTVEQQM